ncbi:hypothetical protein K1W54_03435 [Micromonospora sp. CPCC 205371]|nr:hypothetical protein [Micromonospora sp. CPCC 205371]
MAKPFTAWCCSNVAALAACRVTIAARISQWTNTGGPNQRRSARCGPRPGALPERTVSAPIQIYQRVLPSDNDLSIDGCQRHCRLMEGRSRPSTCPNDVNGAYGDAASSCSAENLNRHEYADPGGEGIDGVGAS